MCQQRQISLSTRGRKEQYISAVPDCVEGLTLLVHLNFYALCYSQFVVLPRSQYLEYISFELQVLLSHFVEYQAEARRISPFLCCCVFWKTYTFHHSIYTSIPICIYCKKSPEVVLKSLQAVTGLIVCIYIVFIYNPQIRDDGCMMIIMKTVMHQ